MAKRGKSKQSNGNGANLGFENKLWAAADKLRGHMDASEYKHVALGLIFLKYVSDAFEEKFNALDPADREDRDYYTAENIFWVPKQARFTRILAQAKDVNIGKIIDDAMRAIEAENPQLKNVLPKTFNSRDLNKDKLGEVIDLIGTIGLGDKESRGKDILGRVYEYFLGRFAVAEGKSGGEFYTPQCVVRLLVEMIEPYDGRVFDPCCGSGGMFVQSQNFVKKWYARHPDGLLGSDGGDTRTGRSATVESVACRRSSEGYVQKKPIGGIESTINLAPSGEFPSSNTQLPWRTQTQPLG